CCDSCPHGIVVPCPTKSALRSTPWGVTMGQQWSFRALNCRSAAIPTSNSFCSATVLLCSRCSMPVRNSRRPRVWCIPTSWSRCTTSPAKRCARDAGNPPCGLPPTRCRRARRVSRCRGLMAVAKIDLRTMAGINRPAIAALWPPLKGESVVLDLGASIGADAEHLVELAAMGSAMAAVLFGLDRPTVGLLNIGVEEVKGLEAVREAGQMLRAGDWPQFEYVGFVEGDDIGKGTVDVVVTEGFSGNIALKAAEGTARQLGQYLKHEMNRTGDRRLGYVLARGAFRALGNKMDPRKSNGGVFLGLNGIVIKSHGGTDAEGFAYAVDLGYDMVRHELLAKIGHSLTRHHSEAVPARAI